MANEKVSFNIDFSGLANYAPVEGIGSSSLLKMDGFYAATIERVTQGKSSTGNNKLILSLSVQDSDERGQSLIADVLVSGTDKNGNPNIRQLGDLLHSLGMTPEAVKALASTSAQPGEAFGNQLKGKVTHVNVEAETYNNNTTSRVRGYISKQRYEDAVSANAHRKPRKADTAFAGAPAGVAAPAASVTTNGTVVTTGSAAGKVDPLSRIAGLNLPI